MKISFIIPVLNGEMYIENCINSIWLEIDREQDEIIVVDNGSTDKTLDLVRKHDYIKIVILPKATIAAMRNKGAENSRGDILAFVDSDCTIEKGWRKAVISTLADNSIGATGSHFDIPHDANWIERAWCSNRRSEAMPVKYINSSNLIVKRMIFDSIGGFNPTLVTDEDYDLCERIRLAGYLVYEEPRIKLIHYKNPKTLKAFFTREKWYGLSMARSQLLKKRDKVLLMTLAFIILVLLSFFMIPLILMGKISYWVPLAILVMVPFITTINRLYRFKNFRYFFQLILLFFLYYTGRSITILKLILLKNSNFK